MTWWSLYKNFKKNILFLFSVWSAPKPEDLSEDDTQDDDPNDVQDDDGENPGASPGPLEFISKPAVYFHKVGETAYLPCEAKNSG